MQDPTIFSQIQPQFPEQEQLKCPRCDSTNTKFCYYNNYNLSQPRHFCKNCRRYWTKGGALRNIPVGGGTRKTNKRSSNPKRSSSTLSSPPSSSSATSSFTSPQSQVFGSFSSLLCSNGQFGNLLMEGLNPDGSRVQFGEFAENLDSGSGSGGIRNVNPPLELQSGNNSERFLNVQKLW